MELPEILDSFIANILAYALILATVATITMTFLELLKVVLELRLKYHRRKLWNWIQHAACREELLLLTVAEVDSADALLDQPTDKMMGQIQAATNVAIDFPDVYPHLFRFLTKMPTSVAAARETGRDGTSRPMDDPSDATVWERFITKPAHDRQASYSEAEIQEATRARARIDHFVARKLDAFQTKAEYEWARRNQYWAVGTAALFLWALLFYIGVPPIPATILALFGGMMSPLAKDVVAALSGLRTK